MYNITEASVLQYGKMKPNVLLVKVLRPQK